MGASHDVQPFTTTNHFLSSFVVLLLFHGLKHHVTRPFPTSIMICSSMIMLVVEDGMSPSLQLFIKTDQVFGLGDDLGKAYDDDIL